MHVNTCGAHVHSSTSRGRRIDFAGGRNMKSLQVYANRSPGKLPQDADHSAQDKHWAVPESPWRAEGAWHSRLTGLLPLWRLHPTPTPPWLHKEILQPLGLASVSPCRSLPKSLHPAPHLPSPSSTPPPKAFLCLQFLTFRLGWVWAPPLPFAGAVSTLGCGWTRRKASWEQAAVFKATVRGPRRPHPHVPPSARGGL